MKASYLAILFCFTYGFASASDYQFNQVQTVTQLKKGSFLHLDSSGRRNVAVSGNTVAVVWEDNRSGKPSVYVSFLLEGKKAFTKPRALTSSVAAYEPGVVALNANRFVVGWEQNSKVHAAVVSPAGSGKPVTLDSGNSRQLAFDSIEANSAFAVWASKKSKYYSIKLCKLVIASLQIKCAKPQTVDNSPKQKHQYYPAIHIDNSGATIAWEDRRHGVTRIHASYYDSKKETFSKYRWLNPVPRDPKIIYGKGIGAMRPVLSGDRKGRVVAVWMDKRDFYGGYDVYSAFSQDAGKTFSKANKAQDMLGANIPQWHASVAVDRKTSSVITVWDDTRDDSPDLWYSVYRNKQWSDDFEVPGGHGAGKQSNPSVTFDESGRVHIVWIDKSDSGDTRLQYLSGQLSGKK